jgi:hypothetical protein
LKNFLCNFTVCNKIKQVFTKNQKTVKNKYDKLPVGRAARVPIQIAESSKNNGTVVEYES